MNKELFDCFLSKIDPVSIEHLKTLLAEHDQAISELHGMKDWEKKRKKVDDTFKKANLEIERILDEFNLWKDYCHLLRSNSISTNVSTFKEMLRENDNVDVFHEFIDTNFTAPVSSDSSNGYEYEAL